MSVNGSTRVCPELEKVSLLALQLLPAHEMALMRSHMASCIECRDELTGLASTAEALAGWPADLLRPAGGLWDRVAERIGVDCASEAVTRPTLPWKDPDWEDVGSGISCKILSTDTKRDRVTMLVRLAPGAEYPPHRHAGTEELHLLSGELWVDDRQLTPGDYYRADAGSSDLRVWSETGCTCVLMTSTHDVLG